MNQNYQKITSNNYDFDFHRTSELDRRRVGAQDAVGRGAFKGNDSGEEI